MRTASIPLHLQPFPTDRAEDCVALPRRVAGQSLALAAAEAGYEDSLTIFRGVARVVALDDPLFDPGLEITASPVEYYALLERIRDGLIAWAEAS